MAEFIASGRMIDLVLLLIGLEAIGLMVLWRMRRCPVPPLATLLILAPGSCLLVAARAALSGAAWEWVSFFLLVALGIHLVDLRQRWQDWDRKNSAKA